MCSTVDVVRDDVDCVERYLRGVLFEITQMIDPADQLHNDLVGTCAEVSFLATLANQGDSNRSSVVCKLARRKN